MYVDVVVGQEHPPGDKTYSMFLKTSKSGIFPDAPCMYCSESTIEFSGCVSAFRIKTGRGSRMHDSQSHCESVMCYP
jgi:hypothetical protein